MKEKKIVLFRASSFGNLMTDSRGSTISEKQLEEILDLEFERDNLINRNGSTVKWTDVKKEKLSNLILKRDTPPELSKTAKTEVENIWLMNEKGFYEQLDNKYIMKGLFNEENGLELISELDNEFYIKNTERITKGNLTGECDILHIDSEGRRIVKDIKSCFTAKTFMNADFSSLYEWQLRVYMYLYDAEEGHLEYTLTDLPDHLLEAEIWKVKNRYGIMDSDDPKAKRIFDQIRTNFVYSTNDAYTLEERRKTYIIKRDLELEKEMLERIPLLLEYYKSITLNKIN